MSNKKKTDKQLKATLYVFTALALLVIAIACSANAPAKKENQQAWPPPGDIDDMSIDDLQKLLDDSLQQGVFELAIFYRDKIRERNGLKKTG
jgi:hypothetical protein